MLTTTPIAARVGTADQIYGRSRRRRRPTAKGLIDRKDHDPNFVARDVSSPHVIQANVESDIISELGVATFEASGGSPHTVVRSVEQTGRARPVDVDVDGQSKAAVPEWHSEEDFGATQEKQTHKSAVVSMSLLLSCCLRGVLFRPMSPGRVSHLSRRGWRTVSPHGVIVVLAFPLLSWRIRTATVCVSHSVRR